MTEKMNTIHKNANTINGWISRREGALLYRLASSVKGNIVEIGSYEGRSTFYMGMAKKDNAREGYIFAVDTYKGSKEHTQHGEINTYNDFINNMKKYNIMDYIKPIKLESVNASKNFNNEISMIFIDGAHDYENVKNDFLAWSPKLKDGGILAFHDIIDWYGPQRVFKEYILNNDDYTVLGRVHSLIYAVKTKPNSRERIKGQIIFILRRIYEILYRLKKDLSK